MKKPCAICDGTNAVTRICEMCEAKPENRDWRSRPKEEQSSDQTDKSANGSSIKLRTRERSRFYTKKAKTVIRALASGMNIAQAAAELGLSIDYVKQVSSYWNKATNGLLRRIQRGKPLC